MRLSDFEQALISALVVRDAAASSDPTGEHVGRVAAELRNALQPIVELLNSGEHDAECGCACYADSRIAVDRIKAIADRLSAVDEPRTPRSSR